MSSRISTTQIYQSSQAHVANAREKEQTSAEKASTFREIVRPSQDPTGWVMATNIKDDIAQKDSIAKNASFASHVLTITENVLSQIQDYAQRAHELAVPASSDGIATEEVRMFVHGEVKGLYDNVMRALNTKYAGKTLLAGFQTKSNAFDQGGNYRGDDGKFQIEIGKGLVVPVNISSEQIIQGRGMQNGVDIPGIFTRLMAGLQNNESDTIRGTLEDLLVAVDQLSLGRTQIGARMTAIERAVDAHEMDRIESLDTVSNIEEVDMVKAFSDLTRDQTVLKAAMSTSEKILTEDPTAIFFNR